jgi:hypothetical protein
MAEKGVLAKTPIMTYLLEAGRLFLIAKNISLHRNIYPASSSFQLLAKIWVRKASKKSLTHGPHSGDTKSSRSSGETEGKNS